MKKSELLGKKIHHLVEFSVELARKSQSIEKEYRDKKTDIIDSTEMMIKVMEENATLCANALSAIMELGVAMMMGKELNADE